MKKVGTLLSVIMVFFSVLFGGFGRQVSAESVTQGTSQYSGTMYFRWPGATQDTYEQYMILMIDGEAVFCIDPTTAVSFGGGYAPSEFTGNDQVKPNGRVTISWDMQHKLELIAHFGYKLDQNDKNYHYTQALIWETTGFVAQRFTGDLSMEEYQSFKSRVLNQAENYKNTPSFNGQSATVKVGDSFTFTDNNNVLQNLVVPSNQDGWNLQKNGNQLVVSPTKDAQNGEIFLQQARDNRVHGTSLIYRKPGSQTVTKLRLADPQHGTVNLTAIKQGNIKVVKVDDETQRPLEGVQFGLYEQGSDTPFGTAYTDANGEIAFNDLDANKTYVIKEIKALDTYRLNDQEFTATVLPAETVTVRATNVPKKYRVSLSKHLDQALDGSGTRVAGANITFDLVNVNTNQVVQSMTTDENGYAQSQDIPYTVPVKIVEHAPEGYQAVEDITVPLDTSKDNYTYHYIIENNVKKSFLQVYKVDAETGEKVTVNHAKFQLFDKNGNKIVQEVTYPTRQSIDTFETDDNGQVTFPQQLIYGQYTLKEVQAPKGYVLSDQPIAVNVTGDETTVTVTVQNTPQKGQLSIEKTGKGITNWAKDSRGVYVPTFGDVKLAGVTFELLKDGQVVQSKTSDVNGKVVFDEVALGDYQYREVSAPKGYVVDNTLRNVTFTAQEQTVRVDSQSASVYNQRKDLTITFSKAFEESKYFENEKTATFGLYTKNAVEGLNADSLVGLVEVKGTGSYTFDNLPMDGDFYIKEMATSKAYELNDKAVVVSYDFSKDNSQSQATTVETTIENKLKRGDHELIKVEANSKERLEGVTFELVAVQPNGSEKKVGTYTSDKDGRVVFKELETGDYKVRETKTIDGYLLNHGDYHFTIVGGETLPTVDKGTAVTTTTVTTVIENEKKPEIHTEATTQSGGKRGDRFEKHIERADLSKLTIGKKYTVVATQYDSEGKAYASQEREFVADSDTRTEYFEFDVPVGYVGNIVYGEDLYREGEKVAVHFDLKDEKQTVTVTKPEVVTEATTQNGGKKGYVFEKHIERADMSDLTVGKKYTVVATQYDSEGNVYATQEREFVADAETHTEFFEFTVPVGYVGNIVYGEDLYREGEKVAVHFDLKNDKQTVEVLKPEVHTIAKVGDNNSFVVGEKVEIKDTLTYKNFRGGQVIVKAWLVKYGTDEVVGNPKEAKYTLNGDGEIEVSLDVDSSTLPAGRYTIMEQVFDVNDKGEKGDLITEHVDNKNDSQTFEVVQPKLPATGSENLGVVSAFGGLMIALGATLKLRKRN